MLVRVDGDIMRRLRIAVLALVAAVGASSCQSQDTLGTTAMTANAGRPQSQARAAKPDLGTGYTYQANPTSNLITIFAKTATGDVAPAGTIAGANTKLNEP